MFAVFVVCILIYLAIRAGTISNAVAGTPAERRARKLGEMRAGIAQHEADRQLAIRKRVVGMRRNNPWN